ISTGLSKKLTMAGSLSRDAKTCSKENDHSLEVSELSGVVEDSSVEDSSPTVVLAATARVLENWMN
uniref:Uncharacterized protein n=1 Tax=Oreochromis aureus TaxID=47969 RepID=A0A668UUA2_OREAU